MPPEPQAAPPKAIPPAPPVVVQPPKKRVDAPVAPSEPIYSQAQRDVDAAKLEARKKVLEQELADTKLGVMTGIPVEKIVEWRDVCQTVVFPKTVNPNHTVKLEYDKYDDWTHVTARLEDGITAGIIWRGNIPYKESDGHDIYFSVRQDLARSRDREAGIVADGKRYVAYSKDGWLYRLPTQDAIRILAAKSISARFGAQEVLFSAREKAIIQDLLSYLTRPDPRNLSPSFSSPAEEPK